MRADQGIVDLSFPSSLKTIWQVAVDDSCRPVMQNDLFLPYDEWFTADQSEQAQGINIVHAYKKRPDNSVVFRKFSDLSAFPSLQYVSVPSDATQYLDMGSISNHLKALSLWVSRSGKAKNLDFFDCDFPELQAATFYYPFPCFNGLNLRSMANIEWLSINLELDNKMASLSDVHTLKKLRGMKLSGVRNKDALFFVNNDLLALEIWGSRVKTLDFTPLNTMRNLRYLKVNSRVDFDCKYLSQAKNIEQICLMNIRNLSNLETLLQLGSLQRLSFRFIQNMYLPDAVQQQFEAKLEFLEL